MRRQYDFSKAKRAKRVPHLARLQAEAKVLDTRRSSNRHCVVSPARPLLMSRRYAGFFEKS
jgi:ribosomal protein L34